jgi:hypothetical protein
MRLQTLLLAVLIGLGLLSAPPARADDPNDPYIASVTSYGKIPTGASFVIDITENTELTSNAENVLQESLTRRGLAYDVSGTLGFKIGTTRSVSTIRPDASFNPHNAIWSLKLDNTYDKGTQRLGHIFRIALTVYERATGKVIARGDVTDNQPDDDPISVTAPMIEKLLNGLEF